MSDKLSLQTLLQVFTRFMAVEILFGDSPSNGVYYVAELLERDDLDSWVVEDGSIQMLSDTISTCAARDSQFWRDYSDSEFRDGTITYFQIQARRENNIMNKQDQYFRDVEEIERITDHVRDWFNENGKSCSAVIGMSGGKDSTIAAMILTRALGKDRVVGVLMPDGRDAYQSEDYEDAKWVVSKLGIRPITIDIGNITREAMTAMYCAENPITGEGDILNPWENPQVKINIAPRTRMMMLRGVAAALPEGGRVINTCNRSETYVGYSTKDGDDRGDFGVLKEHTVREVVHMGLVLGRLMGIPEKYIVKAPADGLTGKTDEENFGFTYEVLDDYLLHRIQAVDPCFINRIEERRRMNQHKLTEMPTCPKFSKYWE